MAQLSRVYYYGSASKKQTFRSDLARWIQANPNHPGMTDALALLNAAPTTTVTPYTADVQKPALRKPVVRKPAVKRPVVKRPIAPRPTIKKSAVKTLPPARTPVRVINKPVVKKPVVNTPKVEAPVKIEPNIRSLYEKFKKQVQ